MGTGPLFERGNPPVDWILYLLVAVFFEGRPSSGWLILWSGLLPELGCFLFLVMAIVWSPDVMYRSLCSGPGDLRENPAFRCRSPFPCLRSLPPRPFSGWLPFMPFLWFAALRWLFLPTVPVPDLLLLFVSCRLQMLCWKGASVGVVAWSPLQLFGRNRLLFCAHLSHIVGSRCSFLDVS